MIKVTCPYCGSDAEYIDSRHYYANGRSYGMIYLCHPCDALVGVHRNSDKPLGSLANKELRELRRRCHGLFDQLWKGSARRMNRHAAYRKLADNMGMTHEEAHIGKFGEQDCLKMIQTFKDRI